MWGCSGSNTLIKLKQLHNRAARILTNGAFDVHSSPLIKNLWWMSIANLIYFSFKSKQVVPKSSNNRVLNIYAIFFKDILYAADKN